MSKAAETAATPPEIVWNSEEGKFETEDKEAYLQYHLIDATNNNNDERKEIKVMDLAHTFVPASKRGLGMANHLCVAAFTHAQQNGMLVIPTCSYISGTFLPRNPAWKSVVYNENEELKSSI